MDAEVFKAMVKSGQVKQHFAYTDGHWLYKYYKGHDGKYWRLTFCRMYGGEVQATVVQLLDTDWAEAADEYLFVRNRLTDRYNRNITRAEADKCLLLWLGTPGKKLSDEERKFYHFYHDILEFMLQDRRNTVA